MQPFSVLMSVYSKEQPEFLHEAMESVFRQTVLPAEVVLVEDGPLTPALDAEIAKLQALHKEIKVVPLSVNSGLGRALDAGLNHCTYSLVARMDTDDVCRPQRFERQLEVMEEHPEIDVCGTWIDEFSDSTEHSFSTRRLPEKHEELVEFGKKRNPMNHMTVMFRKEKVTASGGYQHYPLFEDYYLWVRMMMRGCRFYTIQESLVDVRADLKMMARRGGLKYALTEARLQMLFFGLKYIGGSRMMVNMSQRFMVRLLPNQIRLWLYMHKLRERKGN